MANSTSGLFETLVAAANEATQSLKFPNTMLETVYTSMQPNYATIGQTLNVVIPTVNESDVSDIGAGDIVITDTAHNTTAITFSHKEQTGFVIRNFDQVRTPQDLRSLYLDSRLEALMRKVNRQICQLVTATNFNGYTSITGGDDVFTRSTIKTAWSNLANKGVPVYDAGNVFFVTHTTPYANMTTDSTFAQESIVGAGPADETRKAMFLPQYGAELRYDPQFPQPTAGATYSGLFFHRYAIALRTGVEPPMGDGSIKETVVTPKANIPVKVQMWNSGDKQGVVVNLATCFGLAVVRADHGSYAVTT